MNDFSNFDYRDLMPLAVERLKKQATLLSVVHKDAGTEVKTKGSTVDVQLPVDLGAADDHGAESTATDITAQNAQITLDKHKYKEVAISDKEAATSYANGLLPDAMQAQVDAIATSINDAVISGYTGIYNFSEGGYSTFNKDSAIAARKEMNRLGISKNGRKLVLNGDHEADFISAFPSAAMDSDLVREGILDRKFGFSVFADDNLVDHTTGDADGYTATATAVGATVITLDVGGTGSFNAGDIVEIAGAGRNVVLDHTGSDVTVKYPLKAALVGGESVTVVNTDSFSLALQPTACVVAFRSLNNPSADTGSTMVYEYVDPDSGIPMRMLKWYEPKSEKQHIKLEVLFGTSWVRPDLALRVMK